MGIQVEDDLRKLGEFEQLFQSLPLGILFQNVDGTVTWANPAAADILGRSLGLMLGRCAFDPEADVVQDDGSTLPAEQFPARVALRTGKPVREVRMGVFNPVCGCRVWISVLAVPILGGDSGAVQGVYTVFNDITERRRAARALADASATAARLESDARLRHAAEAANFGIFEYDFVAASTYWSEETRSIVGLSPGAAATRPGQVPDFVHREDRATVRASFARATDPLGDGQMEDLLRIVRPDGQVRWLQRRGRTLFHGEGAQRRPVRLSGVIIDVTVHQQAQERLRRSEERFRRLFEDTRQPVLLIEDGRCVAANKAALALHGMERLEQLTGLSPLDIAPEFQPDGRRSVERVKELVRIALEHGSVEFEWEAIRADGEHFISHEVMTAIRDEDKVLLHVAFNDITEQKKVRAQVEFLALHDVLTGLPNRFQGQAGLQGAVEAARRSDSRLAVLTLGLDKFKFVNDTHGHAIGDRLLRCVADRLSACRDGADTLCRLSGDEFMLVLHQFERDQQVAARCERIQAQLARPFDVEGVQLHTSVSIGVALFPRDGDDSEALLRHADTALYEAKRAGRASYRFFDARMNDKLVNYVQTRDALLLALQRNEFVLHYQPQVELRSARVVGVEALLRWNRPGHGLVRPDSFIAAAEESGLIVPIGGWVLREACRQAARWHAAGWQQLVMAVNLSPVQFRNGQLEQEVIEVLDDSGLDPACLELELTESLVMEHDEAVLATLARWEASGIRLAIDDFGTGYSSMAYLRRFRFDTLKIDQSFVRNLARDGDDAAIVAAMIHIARSLQLKTVAEGVEHVAVAARLKAMGCDEVQGHFYAPPLPAAELERWLQAWPALS
ncbi:MAG: hypothetical protein RJA36_1238 [Pseudomonadota bacterium]|jgi:diguanylate cyclase (GGDEF)-like protein/PAS domain S-box-containing protein